MNYEDFTDCELTEWLNTLKHNRPIYPKWADEQIAVIEAVRKERLRESKTKKKP